MSSKNIRTRNQRVNETEKLQIEKLAYFMWEKDGKPMNCDDKYYWYKAEKKFYSPLRRIYIALRASQKSKVKSQKWGKPFVNKDLRRFFRVLVCKHISAQRYRFLKSGLIRFMLLIVNVTLSVVLFSLFFPESSRIAAVITVLVTSVFPVLVLEKKEISLWYLSISCIVFVWILLRVPKPVSEWSFQRGNCFTDLERQEELKKKNLKNCKDFPLYVNQVNLAEAEKSYLYAIQLNSNKIEAHYNLGGLYEDWGDIKSAERHYVIAINASNAANVTNAIKDWDGLIEAHNNLARLYILNKENERAILLLDKAEFLIANHPLKKIEPDKRDPEESKILDSVEYTVYKNYGWAYFNLGNYKEASKRLRDYAIPIVKYSKELQKITPNYDGAAYCLLVQVQEAQKQKKQVQETQKQKEESIKNYKKCVKWGEKRAKYFELQPEEFTWVEKAKNKLKNP